MQQFAAKDGKDPEPPSGRLIDALRQQITQSPLLQESDALSPLLDSLDRAGDLWTRTQRQNRDALRQLNRQGRIGERSQTPHLVLVTFERSQNTGNSTSPRRRLFAGLEKRGIMFAQHYAGGESPVSGWWTLMTGRNTGRAPHREERFHLHPTDHTITTALWQAGYSTGLFGAWHEPAAPVDCGFDQWTGLRDRQDPFTLYPARLSTARTQMAVPANADSQPGVTLWKLLNVEITSLLQASQKSTRPVLLVVRLPEIPSSGSQSDHDTAESVVEHLLEGLKTTGLSAHTCVFVTELTGDAIGSPLSESSLRVPLVMVGGHADNNGRSVTRPTTACDLLPTLLDIAQASRRTTGSDGISLLLKSSRSHVADDRLLYWESDDGKTAQAVRKGDWKGIAARGERSLRLYHIPSDPSQEKNVAGDHPDVVQQLLAPPAATAPSASQAVSQ